MPRQPFFVHLTILLVFVLSNNDVLCAASSNSRAAAAASKNLGPSDRPTLPLEQAIKDIESGAAPTPSIPSTSSSLDPTTPSTPPTEEASTVTSAETTATPSAPTTTEAATLSTPQLSSLATRPETATKTITMPDIPDSVKLLIGAAGIYGSFLYYGSLQEDVFRYTSADGVAFTQAWFLQALEALANVVLGFVGMLITGRTKGIPLRMFGISGATQVSAKAFTSLALANGLSFPVATLAKSGKMAPVMAGSLILGGESYELREYLQVVAIIGGTAIVSMSKKKGGSSDSSAMGVVYIILSLVMDGVTAGCQKRLKVETGKVGVKPKPYDFMFWTNLFMCATAALVALVLGEMIEGFSYCASNPEIFSKIILFALCSAVGQMFIFYTIANFDPLILSGITTTRKIFSVLLSIFTKGHTLATMGWAGIVMASSGILSELHAKSTAKKGKKSSSHKN